MEENIGNEEIIHLQYAVDILGNTVSYVIEGQAKQGDDEDTALR